MKSNVITRNGQCNFEYLQHIFIVLFIRGETMLSDHLASSRLYRRRRQAMLRETDCPCEEQARPYNASNSAAVRQQRWPRYLPAAILLTHGTPQGLIICPGERPALSLRIMQNKPSADGPLTNKRPPSSTAAMAIQMLILRPLKKLCNPDLQQDPLALADVSASLTRSLEFAEKKMLFIMSIRVRYK